MKDEMDILKEVGIITAAHGSTALSEMLGRRINLKLPTLEILTGGKVLDRIPANQIVISIYSHILTGLKGDVLFILDEKSAFHLVDMCYKVGQEDKKGGILTEMGISTLKEVGNVVISAYAGALSMMLKTVIIPGIPTMASGPMQHIMNIAVCPYSKEEYVLFVEVVFQEASREITGTFYLVVNPDGMKFIQDSCKQLLNNP